MSTILKRTADRLAGFDDPSMGDERERDVILRAYTFALVVTLILGFLAAAVLAFVGFGLWSALPAAVAGIASLLALWYAAQEGVDVNAMAKRAERQRQVLSHLIVIIPAGVWVVALLWHMTTGSPLVSVDFSPAGDGDGLATAIGAMVGAGFGILVVVLVYWIIGRRSRAEDEGEED